MSIPTPSQPTMARRGRAIRVAIAVLAAALGLAGFAPAAMSAARAAPATPTVTTIINATALSTTKINIYDVSTSPVTYEGLFGTTSVLSLSLAPGQYQFNVGGLALSCEPTLDSGGTWTVPSSCGPAASGGGALTLRGVHVRLDALKINDHVYVLSYGEPSVAAGVTATKRLMPGSYDLQPGSGMVAYCRFSLDASDDVTLSGCGSSATASGSTIFFTGKPVTMAATALDTGVVLAANSSAGVKAHKKATLRLMPSPDGYSLVPAAGSVSACYFTLANSGGVTVTYCGSSASASGSRVTFTGFPVALNATKLSTTRYVIEDALQLDGILQSSATIHHYRLLSGSYGFGVGAGYIAHFGWTVTIPDQDQRHRARQGNLHPGPGYLRPQLQPGHRAHAAPRALRVRIHQHHQPARPVAAQHRLDGHAHRNGAAARAEARLRLGGRQHAGRRLHAADLHRGLRVAEPGGHRSAIHGDGAGVRPRSGRAGHRHDDGR